jgi:hypothetical protein
MPAAGAWLLGVLLHRGLVSLERVAQDGTRVRASASAPSFRRESTLLECREQAALHVKAVLADPDPEASEAERLARIAAALDYQGRVEAAIATVQALREEGKKEPRASTTDPEARVMKMPDGGFRLATTSNSRPRVRSSEARGRSLAFSSRTRAATWEA